MPAMRNLQPPVQQPAARRSETTSRRPWTDPLLLSAIGVALHGFPVTATLQAQFVVGEKLPPQPPIEDASPEPVKPQPLKLVYEGEPLTVPLDCAYDHFDRAGIVCSDVTPCELLLELTAVEAAGEKVFVVGNVHTASATVSSVLLDSDDGGKTWGEAVERYSGAALESIRFVSETHGWATGQQRELDSSSKPVLLATHNGGKRWDRYPISKDEEHTGSILEFYFDSEEHGLLIVDRDTVAGDPFELYESMNGGRSWLIRQITSRKPRLRNRPPTQPESEWRVREDAAEGDYKIEQRREGEWAVQSGFAVDLGACTTMEQR